MVVLQVCATVIPLGLCVRFRYHSWQKVVVFVLRKKTVLYKA